LVELTANYNKQIGSVKIEAVGGYSFQSFKNEWMWAAARGFSDFSSFSTMENELRDSFEAGDKAAGELYSDYSNWGISDQLVDVPSGDPTSGGFVSGIDFGGDGELSRDYFNRPAGTTIDAMAANFYNQTDFLQSFFGRGNFTLSDKYMLTATLRVDGSSRFGDENKYGYFPSAAFAWKMHDEAFMPDLFSTFKFRAGYGVVGNQDGLGYGNFVRRSRWADAGIRDSRAIGIPGEATQGFRNGKLRWEQTSTAGAGVDFGIWNEKLSGSFDVYLKNTTDLLFQINSAQPAVNTVVFKNLPAIVENKGWELALAYNLIEKNDASLTIAGNVSYNKNILKDFDGAIDAGRIYGQGLTGAYAQRLAAGYPLFSYHLREFEGFNPDTGQPIGDNQTFIGKTALPTWNAGLSLNGTFKGFDFSTYFTGQFGHYIYNNTQNGFFTAGAINNARNVTKDVLFAGEAGTAEAAVSTRFLSSGDFVRMQNFTVGYSVPLESKTIKKLRFYVNGQNLFVLTNYNGLDPEVSSSPASFDLLNGLPTAGIDYAAYPRPRTYTIGLNLSF